MPLPIEGPAGMTPGCGIAGRAVVVVGDGENPPQGEGPQEPSLDGELGDDTPVESYRMTVPELQQRLALKATREPDHRFGHLYELLTWEPLLDAAADRLLGNKGSRTPGLDGIDRDKLKRNRSHHMALVRAQLQHNAFQPLPVKRVFIPKKNGKMRPLGIPTLYDRWIQMAIKMVLEPIFESDFLPLSHGFRPGRSCATAMAQTYLLTIPRRKKVYWVIEGDIEGFFDHVQHKKLMTLLRVRIQDQRLIDLIWRFLRAGVMEGRLFKKTSEGTPQGGVLSPLLANIYLNRFDHWFSERANLGSSTGASRRARVRKTGGANYMMVRYADDFVIFSNGTKADTDTFKAEVKAWLAQELHLTLSDEKTKLTHYTDGFDFLGYTVKKTVGRSTGGQEIVTFYPSTASIQRAVHRIKELTERQQLLKNPEDVVKALNAFQRGWGEYFRHSAGKNALRYVGNYAFHRLWRLLVEKHGGGHVWRFVKDTYHDNGTWKVGCTHLFVLQSMPIEYPVCRAIPNPFLKGKPVNESRHYDPFMENWSGALAYGADWTDAKAGALALTDSACAVCGITKGIEVNHIRPKGKHGGNVANNLIPLCRTHHRDAVRRNSLVSTTQREMIAKLGSGEPGALKGARPVREGTL